MLSSLGIIQNAYVVNDIDQAIERWHTSWGTGPFIVRRYIVMDQVFYRGALRRLGFPGCDRVAYPQRPRCIFCRYPADAGPYAGDLPTQ